MSTRGKVNFLCPRSTADVREGKRRSDDCAVWILSLSHLFQINDRIWNLAHWKRLSHKLYAALMTTWISALSLRCLSPSLRIYSPCKASSFRTFLTTRRRLGRAEVWLDGRGGGARSGCDDLRKFCSTDTKRVLNWACKTRSIALAQPPAPLLPGGPDMCTFFLSNSQWFNFNDVTEPRTGTRRLGFIFSCWWLINEV